MTTLTSTSAATRFASIDCQTERERKKVEDLMDKESKKELRKHRRMDEKAKSQYRKEFTQELKRVRGDAQSGDPPCPRTIPRRNPLHVHPLVYNTRVQYRTPPLNL